MTIIHIPASNTRYGRFVPVGVNGGVTKIPVGVDYDASAAEIAALVTAGVPTSRSLPDAGMIRIPASYGSRIPIGINGVVSYLMTGVSFIPTAAQLAALDGKEIVYLSGGPAGPTTRTQNIASAMRGPGFETGSVSNGTDTAFNSFVWFRNASGVDIAIPDLQAMYSGWFNDTDANGAERDTTGNISITQAIESPAGTIQALAALTITPGGNIVSAKVPTATGTIAAGAWARLRIHGECAAGVKWPLSVMTAQYLTEAGGQFDHYESGAAGTLADKTMAGTIATSPTSGFRPIAILALVAVTAKPCLATFTDSIGVGASDGTFDAWNNRSWIGRATSGKCPVMQFGVTGTSGQAQIGKMARRLDAIQKAGSASGGVIAALMYGTNNLGNGNSAAQVRDDNITLGNAIVGVGVTTLLTNTLLPRHASNSSPDKWETVGRQVVPTTGPFTAGSGSTRAAYNAMVRGGFGPFTGYFELADAFDTDATGALVRDGGYWLTGEPGGRQYFDVAYSGQVTGSPTTTSVPTNIAKASVANYFAYYSAGYAVFSDGVPRLINVNSGGTLTFGGVSGSTALPFTPAAGDTVTLLNNRMSPCSDGVHLLTSDSSGGFGAVYRARDVGIAKLTAIGL